MYIQIYSIYNHISVDMSNFKHIYLPVSVLIDTNYKIRQDALHTAFNLIHSFSYKVNYSFLSSRIY